MGLEEFSDSFSDEGYSDDDFSFDGEDLSIENIKVFNNIHESPTTLLPKPSSNLTFKDSKFKTELINSLTEFQKSTKSLIKQKNMVKNLKSRVTGALKKNDSKKLYNILGAFAYAIADTKNSKLIDGSLPSLHAWQQLIPKK